MCEKCDYAELLESHGLETIPNRVRVIEIVGNSSSPLSARDVHDTMSRTREINRVTVYRILDLLVEKGLLEKISTADRAFHFGLAPNSNHPAHAHFYCRNCGVIECLRPESLRLEMEALDRTFPEVIEKAAVRLDGICKTCVRRLRRHV
jgi:Fur family ferric uptake transcriptional regulator